MRTARIPKRVPVGTTYVVEGRSGGAGKVQIYSRYLVFPDGRRCVLPSDVAAAIRPHHRPAAQRRVH